MSYQVLQVCEFKNARHDFIAHRWGNDGNWSLVHPTEAPRWVTDAELKQGYEILRNAVDSPEVKIKVQMGKVYKDTLTNFTGTATRLVQYGYDCACLTPRGSPDVLAQSNWFPVANLEEVV